MMASPRNPPIRLKERIRPVCVIGIGSPHGDDRAGWEVIDRLVEIVSQDVSKNLVLHKALVPHDVLDWLDRDTPTHIIDASCDQFPVLREFAISQEGAGRLCLSVASPLELQSIDFNSDFLRSNSTHQLGLLTTLELVATLGRLPLQLSLWTVPITSTERIGNIGVETQKGIAECVKAIAIKLGWAM